MINKREQQIIDFIRDNRGSSSKHISDNSAVSVSYATLKRTLTKWRIRSLLTPHIW